MSAASSDEQVCVQLPTLADNLALPAFPRHAARLLQLIDISCPAQPTAANPPQRHAAAGWDRETDRRTVPVKRHSTGTVVVCFSTRRVRSPTISKKAKVAHTRLPSVGFPSWSRFLAVSLQVTWIINPTVGCHYFPPGLQLPQQPLRGQLPISLHGEQRHDGCEQFA